MKNEFKNLERWVFGVGPVVLFLIMPELVIAILMSNKNREAFLLYAITMMSITLFIYLIGLLITVVKCVKRAQKYKNEEEKTED